MNAATEREQLLLRVQRLGFMLDDLRLFLNTHRNDQEALCALLNFLGQEKSAREQFERRYGPLTLASHVGRCRYEWADDAWPWHVEV